MELLILLTVLTILIIVISYHAVQSSKIDTILRKIEDIQSRLKESESHINHIQNKDRTRSKEQDSVSKPETFIAEKKISVSDSPAISSPPVPSPKKKSISTDFETFVGVNLISKIGIIILVLGIGYFVKYAIDQNWVHAYGRVLIGLCTGILLIGIAYRIRISLRTFSSILTGGGFAVLYLTIAIAFHQYHLLSQHLTFAVMVLITICSVIMALLYDRIELAVFSLFGGYIAPFLAQQGLDDYTILFSYLLILNSGLITLALFKRWHILNILSFIFTVVLFTSWLIRALWFGHNFSFAGAMTYLCIFYLGFFLVNVVYSFRTQKPLRGTETGMILTNNFLFFLAGLILLHHSPYATYKGLFALLTALYNLGWVLYLRKKKHIDSLLIRLLTGIVIGFITLAVPVQLNGYTIPLLWTAEFVILLWLSVRSEIKLIKLGHIIVLFLSLIGIWYIWANDYGQNAQHTMPILLNPPAITGIVFLSGLGISLLIIKPRDAGETFLKYFMTIRDVRILLITTLYIMGYFVFLLELHFQSSHFFSLVSFKHSLYGIFNFCYLFIILYTLRKINWLKTFRLFYYISLISLSLYLVYYNSKVINLRDQYFISGDISICFFAMHYLAYPFLIGVVYLLLRHRSEQLVTGSFWFKAVLWYLTFVGLYLGSTELDTLFLFAFSGTSLNVPHLLEISHRVGYPVLWGIFALWLVVKGIRQKMRDYRILSLSLFLLILLKLFAFDVWKMNAGARITSFISMGIILLIVAFLYQKVRKLLIETTDEAG